MTDSSKTLQEKTEEITPMSRKTDKFVISSAEKETMDEHETTFVDLFPSFPETHTAQSNDVKSVDDTDTQTSVVTTASSEHGLLYTGLLSQPLAAELAAKDSSSEEVILTSGLLATAWSCRTSRIVRCFHI